MYSKVLIANRGAIASRVIRTLRRLGVASVAVYTDADASSLHVRQADEAVRIGEGPAAQSYLDPQRILDAARATGAQAIHPGYGFLSENADFAEACKAAGVDFIGPTPAQLRAFGLKHTARELAQAAGVPLLPGSGLLEDAQEACAQARHVGFPVMLKSTAGGGGIGMQLCADEAALAAAYASVQRLARNHFGEAGIFLERYVGYARHVEVQIFGDGVGRVVALGERDCSVQRRNQKVIEETPAPNIPEAVRARLQADAIALGRSVGYRSAGTVEFVYDGERDEYFFLEVNTRLQVEHGVTEQVWGCDLVEWMVRVAAGETCFLDEWARVAAPRGHSIQVRLYAEDPVKAFQPSAGLLTHVELPSTPDVRVETWIESGVAVPPYYDPMLAKIIVSAPDRRTALARMDAALSRIEIAGIETNRDYVAQVLAQPVLRDGQQYTRLLESFVYRPATLDVLDGGTQTTLQDFPGRVGYWAVGVPPSGPMDDLSHRLANRLLGNPPDSATLEITLAGPTLRFNRDAVVALCGAAMETHVDGEAVSLWAPLAVRAGSVLRIGAARGAGARAYLAVRGGFDAPRYLGSRSVFTLGGFGGHAGRALRAGDVLHLGPDLGCGARIALPEALRPRFSERWELRVLDGPHGAPDFFTDADVDAFYAADWEVHYNSSRTGIRLIGPKPEWARPDGGEAGLHPSNIHDNAYAIGAVDYTGDMPVILGPDGPSLGGFVCPATVVRADRWKLGQLKAGDRVRFVPASHTAARALDEAQEAQIATLARAEPPPVLPCRAPGVLRRHVPANPLGAVTYRAAGDDYLLIEIGPPELDIRLRARVHALMLQLERRAVPGVLDLTPGIRSLQVHYDPRRVDRDALIGLLRESESSLADLSDLEVPSRIVHLPLSWDDPSTRLAIERYTSSVRRDAPWCPSNIEFIRRINGLRSVEDVRRIVHEASYLVLGLGDVYLGAPVATPVDPRHRLVTTKYNPARTWTPENAVGIGGAYLCVYGMEGPGGYQFVGRTLQMWNRWRQTDAFRDGRPWLLRFFDQIRFHPVSAEELEAIRTDFPLGRYPLRIEETSFSLRDYEAFLAAHAASIDAFRASQRAAFAAERERWAAQGLAGCGGTGEPIEEVAAEESLPPDAVAVDSLIAGSVWQVLVSEGDAVAAGQTVIVIESMKMEIAVEAHTAGTVRQVLCQPGGQVAPGRRLVVIQRRQQL
jgi:urea carboxylase